MPQVLKSAGPAWMVSTVNPKLSVFQRAAPFLAGLVGALTVSAIVVVLLVLRQQCATVCATTPLYQIDP
jgi:hypothetical protein